MENRAVSKERERVLVAGSFSSVHVMGNPLYSYTVGDCAFFGKIVFQFTQLPPAISQLRSVLGKEAMSPTPNPSPV